MAYEGPHPYPVKSGGTGDTNFSTPGIVLANGTSAFTTTSTLAVANGGTQNTAPASGQILLGNGSSYVLNSLGSTTNQILVTPSSGACSIALQPQVTNSTQSCFFYYLPANVTSATGNSALVTLGATSTFALTGLVDQNGDFNGTGTGTNPGAFKAPVTGTYLLGMAASFSNIGSAMTQADVVVIGPNLAYINYFNPSVIVSSTSTQITSEVSAIVNMTAGQTAMFQLTIQNGSGNTATLVGQQTSGSVSQTFVYGQLLC